MNVAFIPVRGGSKSIPLKNIKILNGKPLVYWTVAAACDCDYIDRVYVATDSDEIKSAVSTFAREDKERFRKVYVTGRSEESASDTASTETAMLEFAKTHEFDSIVLIQATSPMLTGADLDNGFTVYEGNDTDSVLSVVPQKRFMWQIDDEGIATPSNYDVYNRPRRQEFEEYYVENGAFYITSRKLLLESKNRVSGKIRVALMSEESYYEIDEPEDFAVVEALMLKREEREKMEEAGADVDNSAADKSDNENESSAQCKYKLFLTDCDGCLTDGGMYYSEHGDELKKFNTKDGVAFRLLREAGVLTGVITGEDRELNKRRCEKLKIDVLASGCRDKKSCIERLCDEYNITPEEVVFIGDDLLDIEAIKMVGLGCCPADASEKAKSVAKYITKANGGEGVIREVVEMILTEEL